MREKENHPLALIGVAERDVKVVDNLIVFFPSRAASCFLNILHFQSLKRLLLLRPRLTYIVMAYAYAMFSLANPSPRVPEFTASQSSSTSPSLPQVLKSGNGRRELLISSIGLMAGGGLALLNAFPASAAASRTEFADMPALRGKDYGKTKMSYPDYIETESGLQYKDLRVGSGPTPKNGETVVVDWDGYTIGYYGRIFEARNKTKGGSFEGDDKDFFKFKMGSQEVIPAFEEAVSGMAPGGVRRIIVPPQLGYPENDFNKKGPRPMTFSGQRALDFVLKNQGLIDKTLLFDIELLKIIPS
ncbi:Peptidyl-prolyl cis-trans isomerase fkbp19, chloroplastic [Ancistrocladus abbreviatus]